MLEMSLEKGELSIVDEVIKIIAEIALTEVDGVTVCSSSIKGKLLEKVKIGKNAIKIQTNNGKFTITMQVGIVLRKEHTKNNS
ncbi:Asp23/Gls24 family envelope stress response protein [Anaerobacillus sp. CMMVII]|uniref:Asp23/Gls24 family envelope stress response protein n=1 Tax=Anaerobacillus sp. CMMVII TaxID=2755588 RepID=UPI0021B7D65D|nr:Asp23/Gls24 family envelope stress response protein [Anaerobacillus sp. CMMVII]MCT8139059.1 Asp23/Gls24 family envelope stress response protein [Anaerobacillus sp. CMMVII]